MSCSGDGRHRPEHCAVFKQNSDLRNSYSSNPHLVYLSIHLSMYLFISLSIYSSLYISIHLSKHLTIHLSIYLSIYVTIYFSIWYIQEFLIENFFFSNTWQFFKRILVQRSLTLCVQPAIYFYFGQRISGKIKIYQKIRNKYHKKINH